MGDVFTAARVALEAAQSKGAEGAWRLAALELERDLVCRGCKAGETNHSACDRAFRYARKFRERADKVARDRQTAAGAPRSEDPPSAGKDT